MRTRIATILSLVVLLGLSVGTVSAAPRFDRGDFGGVTPICIAASAADAPAIGQAYVGANGVYVVYNNGEPTAVKVAEEGRLPINRGPAITVEPGTITAPACGTTVTGNNGVTFPNGFCFAEHSANAPRNTPCLTGD